MFTFSSIESVLLSCAIAVLLLCVQLGLSMADMDLLTIGLVNDMFTERENDDAEYDYRACKSDFDHANQFSKP